jgi:hypothetical protein
LTFSGVSGCKPSMPQVSKTLTHSVPERLAGLMPATSPVTAAMRTEPAAMEAMIAAVEAVIAAVEAVIAAVEA